MVIDASSAYGTTSALPDQETVPTDNILNGPIMAEGAHPSTHLPVDQEALRFLLWNTNKKAPDLVIAELAKEFSADIIFLTEYSGSVNTLSLLVGQTVGQSYIVSSGMNKRFACLHRHPSIGLNEIYYHGRFSVRKLSLGTLPTLVCLVHGVDAMNNSLATRMSFAQEMMADLRRLSRENKVPSLVILGDFNLNPYDEAMNQFSVFNAMMSKGCISRGLRKVDGRQYDFFYNPMWSFLGDRNPGPPGTIYYQGKQGLYGWNMFDQVLLHHSLADRLIDIKILDSAGTMTLKGPRGRPNRTYSDHFPLYFSMEKML